MVIEDTFGDYLRSLYPTMTEAESMGLLLKQHGTIRAVSRATGVSLVTVARWGRRLGVTPPPQFVHMRVTKPLLLEKGNGVKDKLLRLYRELGTWRKVAVRLGVTAKELQLYRYKIGLVPKDSFKERCDGGRGLFNTYEDQFGGDYGPG